MMLTRYLESCRQALICLVLLLLSFTSARANHLVGMDLYYTHVSGNTYRVTLVAYGNCGSAGPGSAYASLPSNTPAIHIYNGGSFVSTINLAIVAPSAGVEITPVCPADLLNTQCTNLSYTIPGIKKFVYSATYTLPGASSNWRFLFTGDMGGGNRAGRALSITNISSTPVSLIQLEATLNNTVARNNSPALSVVPTPFFCINDNDNYNPGAVDPDGDALTFNLVTGMDGSFTTTPGGPVTYLGSYSPAAPLTTSSFTFDKLTGQVAFYPTALQRSLVVYNIEERRGGVLVGTCQREMTFLVLTCTNVAATASLASASKGRITGSTQFEICEGAGAYSLDIYPTEPKKTNNITVTSSGIPAGASFTVTGNGTNAPHCVLSWTSTGVAPGTYTFYVTYTDDNCPLAGVTTLAYTITVLPSPTITYTSISPATCTDKAKVSLIPGGAGAPWTIKVADGPLDTIQTITGVTGTIMDTLAPGAHTVVIFAPSPGNCSASIPVTIAPPPPVVITGTVTNPTYCGSADGTIKIAGLTAGETNTINFDLNGVAQPARTLKVAGDGTVTLTGLTAGAYTSITATYGRYCISLPLAFTLTYPPFTMRNISFTNPVYCGICNGSITLYGLRPGQTDTVNYTLDGVAQPPVSRFVGPDSTITITGLCNGTYANFVANTAGLCVSNKLGPVILTVPPFTMSRARTKNPTYCGVCDGTITLHGLHPAQFDTITYTFGGVPQPPVTLFIGGDSAITISGLCVGTYDNFYARTAGKCVSNKIGPVLLAAPPFTMRAVTFTNPDFCGICNGTIKLHGLYPGLTDTITYTIGGVPQPPVVRTIGTDSTATITGLCGGNYDNFIAKNGTSCISNKLGPVLLSVPPFTMRAISYKNPDYCGTYNGSITLYGLHPGQTDTINYTLNGIPQRPISRLIGTDSTVVITGLGDGVYDGFVANTGGVCVSNTLGPVTLTIPPFTMRAVSSTNPDYCGICNGTITLYGLHPGNTDTITYTLGGVPQAPITKLIGTDSQVVITGLCAGAYDNFKANTGGVCVSNTLGPVNLTIPPFTMRAVTGTNPDYCGICNGTITLYGLHPGNTDTITYTLGGVPQPLVSKLIGPDSQIIITGLCAGTYDNFVAHTGGVCISNTLGPVDLTVPPFTVRAIDHTNPDFCGICNGSITLYGLHPGNTDTISYTLGGVPQTPIIKTITGDSLVSLTGLCAGTYDNFIARTGGVCVSNTLGPADLVVPPFTMRKLEFTNPSKCGYCDGSVKLFGLYPGQTDTIFYTLNGIPQQPLVRLIGGDSIATISDLCEGIYDNFIARTGGVCATNMLGPAPLKAPPIVAGYDYVVHMNCKADTVYFTNKSTPAADLTYRWDFGDGTTSVATDPTHIYTKPGVYKVGLVITNTKCYDSSSQNINIDNLIDASVSMNPDSFLCQGSAAVFANSTRGSQLRYTWFYGDGYSDTAASPSHIYYNTGSYKILMTVSNYVPCFDTIVKRLEVDSMSFISMKATDTVLCSGHNVTFRAAYATSGLRNVTWTYHDGTTTSNTDLVIRPFDQAGEFPVKVRAEYRACPDTTASKNILVFGYPEVYLGPDTTICIGGMPLVLTDTRNMNNKRARWEWSTGETTPSITVVKPGLYELTVKIYGCPSTDSVIVINDCYVNIPNVFSPNGDGTNDYFFPRSMLSRGLTTFKMDIFNRWGQQVFATDSPEGRGWDGKFNDVPQPEGVFIYRIEATFKDGQNEKHTGNVTLIR